ncbi:DUF3103 family protein [Streptomyces sp. MMS20-AI2-20]|uniref:DUF3103 family protein n=1 Tax=Streptomyces sp. MMS20-AI2-20 TaxID=2925835 RepID=UPI001F611B6D|nr:DUF3103 family protein [Streptomyces sp. MMS20-AI2-20]MCI4145423.1 DUF3103 domain-containing protein [Streptomyces sp. MMS20-AI2-20]
MRPRHLRRRGALAAAATALAVLCAYQTLTAPQAAAAPAPAATPQARTSTAAQVHAAEDTAARAIAVALTDPAWRARVSRAALTSHEVAVTALADGALKTALASADRRIAAAKGLGPGVGPLLRLRLGDPSMRGALTAGTEPWVAAATSDDGPVTAYDSEGRAHTLDARETPRAPCTSSTSTAPARWPCGLDVLHEELARRGVRSAAPASAEPKRARTSAAAAGFWTTRISAVSLSDDEEPWIKGDAEIYTLVTGFGHDGTVRVDPVDMPYLDSDGTVYRPQQILVNWSSYKYDLADAVMMEDDGSTNYRDLAKAIAAVLLTVTDQGTYIPLVNAVLDAIPDDWWTDDPDYVDSWYTLARTDNGTRYGARGNGWMTVEPYFVQEF